MLIDTGSQVSIINASSCPADVLSRLAPAPVSVTAYNGSAIKGVFSTDIRVGDLLIKETTVYVTNDILKPVLGTPALDKVILDFEENVMTKNNMKATMYKSDIACDAVNFSIKSECKKRPRELYQLYTTSSCRCNRCCRV